MLNRAVDYRYCTPYANGIKGSILPLVDGTASERVNRHEDIAFLTEAVRERYDWCVGRPGGNAQYSGLVPSYETSGLVAVRQTVSELAKAVREMPIVSPGIRWTGLLPHDWSYSGNYPLFTYSNSGYVEPAQPEYTWLDNISFDFACSAYDTFRGNVVVPRVLDNDTLRDIYGDVFSMKRFLWRVDDPDFVNRQFYNVEALYATGRHFATYLSYSDTPASWWRTVKPWVIHNKDDYEVHPATFKFYIREPYAHYLGGSIEAYAVFSFEVNWETQDNPHGFTKGYMLIPLGSLSITRQGWLNFYGVVTWNVTESVLKQYLAAVELDIQRRESYTQLNDSALYFERLYFDTGTADLPTTLPQNAN